MGAGQTAKLDVERKVQRDYAAAREGASPLRRRRAVLRVVLCVAAAAGDLIAIAAAAAIGAAIRQGTLDSAQWVQAAGVLLPAYLLASLALRAYRLGTLHSFGQSSIPAIAAITIAGAFGFCAAFALQVGAQFSRLETLYTLLAAVLLLLAWRALLVRLLRGHVRTLVLPASVLLGDGTVATDSEPETRVIDVTGLPLAPALGDPAFFAQVACLLGDAERVVIAMEEGPERRQWVEAMRLSGLDAELVSDLGAVRPIALAQWGGHATLVISRGPLDMSERIAKRLFDLAVTLAVLPAVLPVSAVLALLVKLDSPGPALFVQERVGRNNRPYRCLKLRTMHVGLADRDGAVSASPEDRRVTRLGRFLRRTSLDELPQLWNVLAGDMSLVGPRPHALGSRAEGALFWELVPDYWSRHSMKPGVTGLAQVRGLRGATHRRSDLESRLAADLEYINRWSLWLDVQILLRTLLVLVHRNAY